MDTFLIPRQRNANSAILRVKRALTPRPNVSPAFQAITTIRMPACLPRQHVRRKPFRIPRTLLAQLAR